MSAPSPVKPAVLSHKAIIGLWPSATAFASAIGLKRPEHARIMKLRNSISPSHWPSVIAAAKAIGIDLTEEELRAAHALGRRP